MLQEAFSDLLLIFNADGRLCFAVLVVCVPLITYVITWLRCMITMRSTKVTEPPIVPYWIPFVGNLIPFLRDVPKFASDMT